MELGFGGNIAFDRLRLSRRLPWLLGGGRLKRAVLILLVLCIPATLGHAEPRWCSISGIGASDAMPYPAIARAARVSGVVVGRIQFLPSGTVTGFDPVFGPPMLLKPVAEQLRKWTIQTSAAGQEPCQTLAVFKFSIGEPNSAHSTEKIPELSSASGIFALSVRGEIPCLCDPAVVIGRRGRFPRIFFRLKRILFGIRH